MMKCSIQGCPGRYRRKLIIHPLRRGREVLVFEKVPAEVCDVCSDTLLKPQTIQHIEKLLLRNAKPRRHAALNAYA
jgi:YgiT-type zinc finger domain-containing protein